MTPLPRDIKQEALWVVRGYRRRKAAYYAARRAVLEGSSCQYESYRLPNGEEARSYGGHGSSASRTSEDRALRLEAIDRRYEARSFRAVDQARREIGKDIQNADMRRDLQNAIIMNCGSRFSTAERVIPGTTKKARKD